LERNTKIAIAFVAFICSITVAYLVIGATHVTYYDASDRLYDKGWTVYECKSSFPDYVAGSRIEVYMPYGYTLEVKKSKLV